MWVLTSPRGLALRIAVGTTIFAVLLAIDLLRFGRRSRRLREYSFLIAATLIGVVYGALNDLMTATISWEYFLYGKGLDASLGPNVGPHSAAFKFAAMRIGMMASGTGALIGAAILLTANSIRSASASPLPLRRLLKALWIVWLSTIATSVALGVVGAAGGLAWTSTDLSGIVRNDLFRPRRFVCVYGIHLGAYLGAIAGTILATRRIARERFRIERRSAETH